MAITDLTNTTWKFNSSMDYVVTEGLSRDFTVTAQATFGDIIIDIPQEILKNGSTYNHDDLTLHKRNLSLIDSRGVIHFPTYSGSANGANTAKFKSPEASANAGKWELLVNGTKIIYEGDVYITFTGGDDATNSELIGYMEQLATLVEEEDTTPKRATLEGATVTIPSGWTAVAEYGKFNLLGTNIMSSNGVVLEGDDANVLIGYNTSAEAKTNGLSFIGITKNEGNKTSSLWTNDSEVTIEITGGADVNNPKIIEWLLNNNATIEGGAWVGKENIVRVYYKDEIISMFAIGQTATFECENKKMASDVVLTFGSAIGGTITYNEVETTVQAGKTATLNFSGKKITSNIVISAGEQEQEDDSIVGAWVFNDTISTDGLTFGTKYSINFKYAGPNGPFVYIQWDGGSDLTTNSYLRYRASSSSMPVYYWASSSGKNGWQKDGMLYSYKTIIITSEEADDEIKTWLKANATKQS